MPLVALPPRRAALLAAASLLVALGATAQTSSAPRLVILDQDAGFVNASSAGALMNFDASAGLLAFPLLEASAANGAPFEIVSGLEISPFDARAYVTDLGASGNDGAIYSVIGGAGGENTVLAGDANLPDPFDLTFVPTGAAGRRLVVSDWDADPSGLGADNVGGAGHGALYWVDEATGALTLLADGTDHPAWPGVPLGDSAFEDPVSVAWSDADQTLYVADLSADPLGLGYTGAVYAVNPADGLLSLVSSGFDFLALTSLDVAPDGSLLVVDGVQADSVVWEIDVANPDPEANYSALTGGTQYALLEGIDTDAAGNVYLADSGEYDSGTMSFILPPRLWKVDLANSNPGTNGVILNESTALTLPVSVHALDQVVLTGISPANAPPITDCTSVAPFSATIDGRFLSPGLDVDLGPNVTVHSVVFPTPATPLGAQLIASVQQDFSSFSGPVDLIVTHPFGVVASIADAITFTGVVASGPCSPKGDANCDGIVDGVDLTILGRHYTQEWCVHPDFYNDADFNDDDAIDGEDLAILATFFGTRP